MNFDSERRCFLFFLFLPHLSTSLFFCFVLFFRVKESGRRESYSVAAIRIIKEPLLFFPLEKFILLQYYFSDLISGPTSTETLALPDHSGTSDDQIPVKSSPQRPIRLDIIPPPPLIPNTTKSGGTNGIQRSPMVCVKKSELHRSLIISFFSFFLLPFSECNV